MPEKCPPSRCEIHLEKSIDDGFKWSKVVRESGVCEELAQKAQDRYDKAKEAFEGCHMREAFDALRQADLERAKVLRCLELNDHHEPGPALASGSFASLKLGKPGRRPALQKSKRRK